jgi:hypothetical protein
VRTAAVHAGVRASLLPRRVPTENIRYEMFGPDLWAGQL